jgi:TolB-like protein/DNA-binding winged helix-turn-helix (wHTH) protein/thioredoxin-like negative regulator of GroEL
MSTSRQYIFGEFRLDAAQRALFRKDELVSLTPKALETLLFLVEKHGRIVDKKELMEAVWPDTFVEEVSLARNVSVLRKILSANEDGQSFIETIPKRGYRFVTPVRESFEEDGDRSSIALLTAKASRPERKTRARWAAAILILLTGVGVAWYRQRLIARRSEASRRIMLAVLPVQNLTGDVSREYVSDGLTEEMIAELGTLNPSKLAVIARTSSMAYKQTTKTVGQIGQELGVDYVLEASLRGGPGEMRFTAQLIRTSDQTHVWAHTYERPVEDVIALQGELARAVAEEIRLGLPAQQEVHLSTRRTIQRDAYDAYVQGRYHWNERSAKEVQTAISFFEQAISKDPNFAAAYSGLADSYTLLTMMRTAPAGQMMPKAKDALLKALAIDDLQGDAHTVLGEVTEVFGWNWQEAEKEYKRAIELDPNNSNARHQYAIHLAVVGRFPAALAEMRQAQQIDPVSPVVFTSTGWILLRARLPDRAILECQKAVDLNPKFARGYLCLGEAYEEKKDYDRAAQEFLAGRMLTGMSPESASELRKVIQESGYKGYFRLRLKQLEEKAKKEYVSPYDFADFWVRLDDRDQAIRWLQTAYEERSPYLVFLQIEPRMDPLRSDPRFQEIVRGVGFPSVPAESLGPHSLENSK